jgi:hypothetical protein
MSESALAEALADYLINGDPNLPEKIAGELR